MLLATIALAQLLQTCASNVSPRTMGAVVRVESGGNPLAMHDNTAGRSFSPGDGGEAVAWASQLIGMGHSVDIGLSQVNSANLSKLGLSVAQAFDPCMNLHAGATILGGDYAAASARFGPGQTALRRALGAYNTGSLFAGQGYVNRILVAAGLAPDDGTDAPVATAAAADGRHAAPAAPDADPPSETTSTVIVYGAKPSYTAKHMPTSPVQIILGNP